MIRLLGIWIAAIVVILTGCAETPVVNPEGGGASETIATVEYADGNMSVRIASDTQINVAAHVLDAEYSLVNAYLFKGVRYITDTAETWNLNGLTRQSYNIFVLDTIAGTSTCFNVETDGDTMVHLSRKLNPSGALDGIVEVEKSGEKSPAIAYNVFLVGSPFITQTDETGAFYFTGIPEGEFFIDATLEVDRQPSYNKGGIVQITGDSTTTSNILLPE